jgi:uncharacterized protein YndB with AHSA1/START domain
MPESAQLAPIVVEQVLADPPHKVWRVLTEPALLRAWLMEGNFQASVGYRCTLHGGNGRWDGVVACEVLDVEAPVRLVYRWRSEHPAQSQGRDTRVTWALKGLAQGTQLHLEHAGFGSEERAGYEQAVRTWQRSFKVLTTVTEWLVA